MSTSGDRGQMTETYERSASGARLTVTVKIDAPLGDVTFKRVYDLVETQPDPKPGEGGPVP